MTTEELEDFKKMWENPEKIYLPEKDYDAIIKHLILPQNILKDLQIL
jgi:hypothetical protein